MFCLVRVMMRLFYSFLLMKSIITLFHVSKILGTMLKGKSSVSPYNLPWRNRRRVEVLLYSFFNLCARWWWVVNATPCLLYPEEWPSTHCIGDWGWSQGWSGWVWKISPPLGFDPRTVQPIAHLSGRHVNHVISKFLRINSLSFLVALTAGIVYMHPSAWYASLTCPVLNSFVNKINCYFFVFLSLTLSGLVLI